jgi:hypothetical protein
MQSTRLPLSARLRGPSYRSALRGITILILAFLALLFLTRKRHSYNPTIIMRLNHGDFIPHIVPRRGCCCEERRLE